MTSCWIVTEAGLTGTENQCIGVAAALGVEPEIRHIGLRQPWQTLSPWIDFGNNRSMFTGDPLDPPWPDLVIASGRKSVAAARYIKRASGNKTFVVYLQNPHISPRHFDLVAAPAHDGLKEGPNVLTTQATPNRVTAQRLLEARAHFEKLLGPRFIPRVAVLIGGSSSAYTLTPAITRDLAKKLRALTERAYGLLITASRRTGEENRAILEHTLSGTSAYIWDGTGENPYYGFLAWADYIIVTSDSASMISEAATTGKPVYMVKLDGGSARFDRLHKNLLDKGVIRLFNGTLEPYDYAPLNDAALVAAEIRKRMKER